MIDFNYANISTKDQALLSNYAMHILSSPQGSQNTFVCAEYLIKNNILGAFIECGVAYGGQIMVMCAALRKHSIQRDIYVIDSFEGIPMCSEKDGEQPGFHGAPTHDTSAPLRDRLVSSGMSVCDRKEVARNLASKGFTGDHIHYLEGWFQDTLPSFNPPKIALLRLDGDLYESTYTCLEYLYPSVTEGGVVIIDDYGLKGCKKAVHDYLNEQGITVDIGVKTDYGGSHWIKPFTKMNGLTGNQSGDAQQHLVQH